MADSRVTAPNESGRDEVRPEPLFAREKRPLYRRPIYLAPLLVAAFLCWAIVALMAAESFPWWRRIGWSVILAWIIAFILCEEWRKWMR